MARPNERELAVELIPRLMAAKFGLELAKQPLHSA